jgi:hypothetical protein
MSRILFGRKAPLMSDSSIAALVHSVEVRKDQLQQLAASTYDALACQERLVRNAIVIIGFLSLYP